MDLSYCVLFSCLFANSFIQTVHISSTNIENGKNVNIIIIIRIITLFLHAHILWENTNFRNINRHILLSTEKCNDTLLQHLTQITRGLGNAHYPSTEEQSQIKQQRQRQSSYTHSYIDQTGSEVR